MGQVAEDSHSALHTTRVVAVGTELRIPHGDYRVIPGDCLEDLAGLAGLEALASEHGAVLFDAYDAYFEEWSSVVLMHLGTTRSILTIGNERYRVISRTPDNRFAALTDNLRWVDLAPWSYATPWNQLPAFGQPERLRGYGIELGHRGWETAVWTLVPDPPRLLRDWAWIWTPTWGPLSFTLDVEADASAITRMLARHAPTPYVNVGDGEHRYPVGSNPPWIRVHERLLQFLRSYPQPAPEVVAYDADVLAALLGGALGELAWSMQDQEYGDLVATGDDAASLAEYLSPTSDADAVRAKFDRPPHGPG